MQCVNHDDVTAKYECTNCQILVCEECVKSFQAGGFYTYFCPECNSRCEPYVAKTDRSDQQLKDEKKEERVDSQIDNSSSSNLKKKELQEEKSAQVIKPSSGLLQSNHAEETESKDSDSKLIKPVSIKLDQFGNILQAEVKEDKTKTPLPDIQPLEINNSKEMNFDQPVSRTVIKNNNYVAPQTENKENTHQAQNKRSKNISLPYYITVFFKIFYNPAQAFQNGILEFNKTSYFRTAFTTITSMLLFGSLYLKSLTTFNLMFCLEVILINLFFAVFLTWFLSCLGKIASKTNFIIFVLGISTFIFLLQNVLLAYFDCRTDGIYISVIAFCFLILRAYIFVKGIYKSLEINCYKVLLLFLIAFFTANVITFFITRLLINT